MNTEQEKLQAALDVVKDSFFHGWSIDAKIEYIRAWLPDHYTVRQDKQDKDSVRCISEIGIIDDESWQYFLSALKQRFKELFLEVYHEVCYNHKDFVVYFKTM